MKTTKTMWVMLIALAAATSCSETETEIDPESGNDGQVPLGITEYTGHHVWYMGDEKGANWISIKEKNDTYKSTKEAPYYLTKTVGKVYAYYPYDANLTKTLTAVTSESDLKIPVTVLADGEINATANNAKRHWEGDKWSQVNNKTPENLSLSTEKDYLVIRSTWICIMAWR